MIGGFGLVAYPARWGNSGVMTFDLQPRTASSTSATSADTQAIVSQMTLFDPGTGWVRTKDQ